MTNEIQYFESEQHNSFYAMHKGRKVGEITYIRVGINKLIIDFTNVEPDYRNQHIGLTLVRNVANMARSQKKYVVTLCPFARAMFNKYSEFDDIRLMHMH